VVVGVTGEAPEAVEAYVKAHGVRHPIAVGFKSDYAVGGIPHAFLIDQDGKIAWRGHPATLDERRLAPLLVGARPANVRAGLEDVHSLRFEGKFGEAYELAARMIEHDQLSEAAVLQAKQWNVAAEHFVATALEQADAAERSGDVYLTWCKLDPVVRGYVGVPGSEPAEERLRALLADKRNEQEIDAGKRFAAAERLEAALDYDAAIDAYDELGKRFGRTRAGKDAKRRHQELVKAGMLGYRADCTYCRAGEKACPTHRRKK